MILQQLLHKQQLFYILNQNIQFYSSCTVILKFKFANFFVVYTIKESAVCKWIKFVNLGVDYVKNEFFLASLCSTFY